MRYVAAYLLATLGGKDNPTPADIEKILSSVGIEADQEKLTKLFSELKGKNVDELIAKGKEKLATMPAAGAVASAPAATVAAPEAVSAAKAPEPKKEEKEEESDDDMGFGLFD